MHVAELAVHSFHSCYLSQFEFAVYLGVSLIVAIQSVRNGAAAEGMKVREYIWRGHDPTAVAVMTQVKDMFFIGLN